MAHYIDADRLRAEIVRRILQEQGFEDGDAEYGYKCALKDIKRFIDSLQQEQPEMDLEKELEKEVERFYRTDEYRLADTLGRGFETLARHFAEWGAAQARKEDK